MNLMPDEFAALDWREFWIKHRAFSRAEDRRQALVIDLALRTADYKDSARGELERAVNALRRYPEKQWLK
jgi:hypothetical protein